MSILSDELHERLANAIVYTPGIEYEDVPWAVAAVMKELFTWEDVVAILNAAPGSPDIRILGDVAYTIARFLAYKVDVIEKADR